MAPPAGTLRVGRYFMALFAILVVLYALVFWPGTRHVPKLGLDLAGGQQVVFNARTPDGKTPSKQSMEEAKRIMEERVNGTGVTEATVVIQGSDQLVVSIPGATNADLQRLGAAAQLTMRPLVMPAVSLTPGPIVPKQLGQASGTASASATPSATTSSSGAASAGAASSSSAKNLADLPAAKATGSTTPAGSGTASASPSAAGSSSATTNRTATPFKGLGFAVPTSEAEYDKLSATQQTQLRDALTKIDCTSTSEQSDSAPYYVACDTNNNDTAGLAYLLGSVIVPGTEIKTASAQAPNAQTAQWTVALQFKPSGNTAWAEYTAAHNVSGNPNASSANITTCSTATVPCADFVAFTLDGVVITAPVNQEAINGGTTQISGSFTQQSATTLANQLKYGALPLSFSAGISQSVSATLGSSQLQAGLLAGGIGLILVIIYSLIYYRALGLVTIASLVVSGLLTYGFLVVLGNQIGFTLSLAGIAGFIVAIGITADSFVVFFERIKDEVHDGRSVRVAVPRAWTRARRTILSADTVSFLAAAILYYFAAGDVKGFAFTLGMSTILDLVVVFLFTHPLVSLLSRSKAFGSPRFTGLDALRGAPVPDDAEPAPRGSGARRSAAAQSRAAQAEPDRESAADRAARRRGRSVAVADPPGGEIVEHDTDDPPSPVDSVLDGFDTETETAADTGSAGAESTDVESATAESAGIEQGGSDAAESAVSEPEEAGGPPARPAKAGKAQPAKAGKAQPTRAKPTRRSGGGAAERAAARRARMREQGTEKES